MAEIVTSTPSARQATPTVYLSQLTLDLRRRDVWRLLADTYAVHRCLLQAFPEVSDGGKGNVLFRVDSGKGEAKILVQSSVLPDWSRLDRSGQSFLAEPARGPKEWRLWSVDGVPVFKDGQQLRFRLCANPTYRCAKNETRTDEVTKAEKTIRYEGKRYHVETPYKQGEWLARKGKDHGFELAAVPSGKDWMDPFFDTPDDEKRETGYDVHITPRERLLGTKTSSSGSENSHKLCHYGVDFDGLLTVTDAEKFAAAVATGIGSAKGFGFGLLSVSRP